MTLPVKLAALYKIRYLNAPASETTLRRHCEEDLTRSVLDRKYPHPLGKTINDNKHVFLLVGSFNRSYMVYKKSLSKFIWNSQRLK